jgi:hypothetical protein
VDHSKPLASLARAMTVAAVCMLLCGCGGYVSRGRMLYQEGRYIEAAEVLASREHELTEQPLRRQGEYAAYRGLANLELGNYPEAMRWMNFAYEIERRFPGTLRPEFRKDLDPGWWTLLQRMGLTPATAPAQQPRAVR